MTSKRGPYAKSDVRRRSLSAAALELVRQKGHRNVAIAEIAQLANTSEPTVYYHFPTKESLLIAALQQHDEENARARGHETGAIAEMGSRAEAGVQRTNYAQLYNELAGAAADPAHPANEFFRQRWARSVDVVATDIRRLQESGRVPADVERGRRGASAARSMGRASAAVDAGAALRHPGTHRSPHPRTART